mmetsp:Transcript_32841/g.104589  ORF Transcript_32841/g.104589 Transcript_32841/m.104589 type:complete len:178 (-) Transcript_32841:128-661(-)
MVNRKDRYMSTPPPGWAKAKVQEFGLPLPGRGEAVGPDPFVPRLDNQRGAGRAPSPSPAAAPGQRGSLGRLESRGVRGGTVPQRAMVFTKPGRDTRTAPPALGESLSTPNLSYPGPASSRLGLEGPDPMMAVYQARSVMNRLTAAERAIPGYSHDLDTPSANMHSSGPDWVIERSND